jgi:protein-tyrosine-phosphatase
MSLKRTRISSVLFVCERNAVRSPMAQALAEAILPRGLYVASAGVLPGENEPFVDAVLAEIGLSTGEHRPVGLEELEDMNFDLVVTLSPEAHHRVLELTRIHALDVEYWPMPDPTGVEGSRPQVLAAYRDLRDRLSAHIAERLASPNEFTAPPG